MNRPHAELREALGALALGQLDDSALRSDVEAHLATCDGCRAELADIQPLVVGLRQVDPDALQVTAVVPPAELDERVRRTLPVRPGRARQWVPLAGAAAAAAVVAVIVTTAVTADDDGAPAVIAVPQVQSAPGVTAAAGLVDHTWGLEIKLEATGLAAGERFRMWVVGDDGESYDAGELLGVADTTITCDMASSVLLHDAASFRVVDSSGDAVITGDVPS